MKAQREARSAIRAALTREVAPRPTAAQPTADAPIDLDAIESDEPLMTAAGVPASFFPPITYDEDGRPRPARLYDVSHRDDPTPEPTHAEDVSDARTDDTYRPLG